MARRKARRTRRRPPWWFMPAVMSGLAVAAAGLSAVMMTVVE
ncbi:MULTISPECIES: hypothetical protein [Sphingomonadaceae]|jgi:hypothetical protein|nr:hypothetical protein [Sphingobium sp. 3R8]